MKAAALKDANRLLSAAAKGAKQVIEAKSHEEARAGWIEFVHAVRRWTQKLGSGCKGDQASQDWFKKIMKEQKDSQLLAYIMHARNADEYGIAEQSAESATSEFFVFDEPIKHPDFSIPIGAMMPRSSFLMPVVDRGVTYDPPGWYPNAHMNTCSMDSPRRAAPAVGAAFQVYDRWAKEAAALPVH